MERKEKIGGAYLALFLLTAAFLASLLWLTLRGGPVAAADGYAVSVQRSVPAEQLAAPEREKVDLNTATAEELQKLEGIGPVLSQRIVEYRTLHGAFTSVDELLEVNGIGSAKLEAIRNNVTLGEETAP